VTDCGRACGKSLVKEFLVLPDEMLELPFLSRDLVQGCKINLAKPLNVDGSSVLGFFLARHTMVICG
jgi:hypothetical protein